MTRSAEGAPSRCSARNPATRRTHSRVIKTRLEQWPRSSVSQ